MKSWKQNLITVLTAWSFAVCGMMTPTASAENAGNSTPDSTEDILEIATEQDLRDFAESVQAGNTKLHAVLTADIISEAAAPAETTTTTDAAPVYAEEWLPIGDTDHPFAGVFDGQGYSISGICITAADGIEVGLFGKTVGAEISNVKVENSLISGKNCVGGIVGNAESTEIENCTFAGEIVGGNQAGGICGCCYGGTITDCQTEGSVSGNENIGGVCGILLSADIAQSESSSTVTGVKNVGGLVGRAVLGNITASSAASNVSGETAVGGICGLFAGSTLEGCSTESDLMGEENVGGIAGKAQVGTIAGCFSRTKLPKCAT